MVSDLMKLIIKKIFLKFFIFIIPLFYLFPSHAGDTKDSDLGGNIEQQLHQEPLFVSLGSVCKTALMHRECGIRKAAFPFDWIVSFDGEKLIEIIKDDFLYFLNPNVLRIAGQTLLNDYYCLEFPNEGDWQDAAYAIEGFITKCQRRIDRFRQLANYSGKVFFVRTAYPYSLSDPNRIWKVKENIDITPEYAEKLYITLRRYFSNLDFQLIIMNGHDKSGFSIEEQFFDHILMVRIDEQIDSYKDFYSKLISNNL